ncbi:hypothetical protein NADFUDRAFT_50212 [Nadsonia fulvescens var. elongata DSM 6958]|uniref:tRNA (adenine(58)-N(1))-methyltransferase catalytic subunit TRM61 n=1 Tax=Nadsonia fulvescens var. elongata DSM 6958 TaxID=857566 RepID=A0A1E3PMX4_9ASCO|nr:hypothetical protein NADFUDRAFT_50212 [Nadsonia fulvescens var. elongata DSM 6958]
MYKRGIIVSKSLNKFTLLKTRYYGTEASTFQLGDIVLLRDVVNPDRVTLSSPLKSDEFILTPHGKIPTSLILGRPIRDSIHVPNSKKNSAFLATLPTMEEFIVNRRRDAQPIYPLDAHAIVGLADIHVDRPVYQEKDGKLIRTSPPLQILESGTGHGSLTLAISRAIHGANTFSSGTKSNNIFVDGEVQATRDHIPEQLHPGALLHSIDKSSKHSQTGSLNVKHFRRGIYYKDVKFHVANSPADWLNSFPSGRFRSMHKHYNQESLSEPRSTELMEPTAPSFDNEEAFLSAAFLDLPSPEDQIDSVSKNLLLNAPLIVFCPSVSQIQKTIDHVQEHGLDLIVDRVVELMPGMGGSLREWDVRNTTIRSSGESAWVVRPKVGTRVVGGGFVAVFKKVSNGLKKPRKEHAKRLSSLPGVNDIKTKSLIQKVLEWLGVTFV